MHSVGFWVIELVLGLVALLYSAANGGVTSNEVYLFCSAITITTFISLLLSDKDLRKDVRATLATTSIGILSYVYMILFASVPGNILIAVLHIPAIILICSIARYDILWTDNIPDKRYDRMQKNVLESKNANSKRTEVSRLSQEQSDKSNSLREANEEIERARYEELERRSKEDRNNE